MGMNLYAANDQWASRPADERFETLENLCDATRSHAATAKTVTYPTSALEVVPTDHQMANRKSPASSKKLHPQNSGIHHVDDSRRPTRV